MTTTTQIKERPILFSSAMIRAILDGKKTVTRRVIKPQPIERPLHAIHPGNDRHVWYQDDGLNLYCPYGQPGDHLWVKEALGRGTPDNPWAIAYESDNTPVATEREWDWQRLTLPSMFMPRWASRITLRITDIRVERVQDISLEDMRAEGVRPDNEASLLWRETLRANFCTLWDEINEKRGYGWASNPWCWVVAFEVVKP